MSFGSENAQLIVSWNWQEGGRKKERIVIFIGKLVLHQMMAFSKHLKVPCTEHNVYHICGDEELKLEDRTLSHSPVLAMPATS